jgi:hypothetical protein
LRIEVGGQGKEDGSQGVKSAASLKGDAASNCETRYRVIEEAVFDLLLSDSESEDEINASEFDDCDEF